MNQLRFEVVVRLSNGRIVHQVVAVPATHHPEDAKDKAIDTAVRVHDMACLVSARNAWPHLVNSYSPAYVA